VFAEASVAAVFTSVPLPLMFTHGAFFKVPCGRGGVQCPLLAHDRRPPPTSTLDVLFPRPPALRFPGTTLLKKSLG